MCKTLKSYWDIYFFVYIYHVYEVSSYYPLKSPEYATKKRNLQAQINFCLNWSSFCPGHPQQFVCFRKIYTPRYVEATHLIREWTTLAGTYNRMHDVQKDNHLNLFWLIWEISTWLFFQRIYFLTWIFRLRIKPALIFVHFLREDSMFASQFF
jgi:hypothetical protein